MLRAPTAGIVLYLSSAQLDITNEPYENIRKPTIRILALDFSSCNRGGGTYPQYGGPVVKLSPISRGAIKTSDVIKSKCLVIVVSWFYTDRLIS